MALKGLESFSMPLDKISRSSAIIIRHLAKEFPSERLGNGRNGVHDIRRHKWFQVCLYYFLLQQGQTGISFLIDNPSSILLDTVTDH